MTPWIRVGQNRICTPNTTVYLVIFLQIVPYTHVDVWFWPTLPVPLARQRDTWSPWISMRCKHASSCKRFWFTVCLLSQRGIQGRKGKVSSTLETQVDGPEPAIQHCNASSLALQGCVFTQDINKAIQISDAMETGTVQVCVLYVRVCICIFVCVCLDTHILLCKNSTYYRHLSHLLLPTRFCLQINAAPARGPGKLMLRFSSCLISPLQVICVEAGQGVKLLFLLCALIAVFAPTWKHIVATSFFPPAHKTCRPLPLPRI